MLKTKLKIVLCKSTLFLKFVFMYFWLLSIGRECIIVIKIFDDFVKTIGYGDYEMAMGYGYGDYEWAAGEGQTEKKKKR